MLSLYLFTFFLVWYLTKLLISKIQSTFHKIMSYTPALHVFIAIGLLTMAQLLHTLIICALCVSDELTTSFTSVACSFPSLSLSLVLHGSFCGLGLLFHNSLVRKPLPQKVSVWGPDRWGWDFMSSFSWDWGFALSDTWSLLWTFKYMIILSI